jgi:phosphoribosylanthranilate isomerase
MASVGEAQLAIRAGVDAVGFVGVRASPRAIDDRTIAAIVALVPPPVATFLLTSECTAAGIAQRMLAAGASTVQIVSHLSPSESEQLPKLLPTTRRVQVIHVESESALDLIIGRKPEMRNCKRGY